MTATRTIQEDIDLYREVAKAREDAEYAAMIAALDAEISPADRAAIGMVVYRSSFEIQTLHGIGLSGYRGDTAPTGSKIWRVTQLAPYGVFTESITKDGVLRQRIVATIARQQDAADADRARAAELAF